MGEIWIIISPGGLYWSDLLGWVSEQRLASTYTQTDRYHVSLPGSGSWLKIAG